VPQRTVLCASGATATSCATVDCNALNARLRVLRTEDTQLAHRTDYRTCPAHRAVSGGAPDCLVRHATPAFQQPYFGGWGYKYPNHPTFNGIPVFHLQHITRAIAFNSRHSKEIKSSPKSRITPNQIVTRESDICVLLSSCAWIASFLSHSSCD
jgi:hypothetical protein